MIKQESQGKQRETWDIEDGYLVMPFPQWTSNPQSKVSKDSKSFMKITSHSGENLHFKTFPFYISNGRLAYVIFTREPRIQILNLIHSNCKPGTSC